MQPGERLGPYEIVAKLGAGGMGDVYSARDTRLGRTVAGKRTRDRFSDRFEREARAISALNHPNICQLYDVGPDYLVMELVDGAPIAPVDNSRKPAEIRGGVTGIVNPLAVVVSLFRLRSCPISS